MSNSQITVLPVDNGDSIMIEHDGCVVITDLNYRRDSQDDDEECYDIGADIRDACFNAHDEYVCDVFVLTHPDEDHRGGFEDLFYIGDPSKWTSAEDNILVRELWVSEYMTDTKQATESSKFMFDEVARRKGLIGTATGNDDGNRIKILNAGNQEVSGNIGDTSNLEWQLFAPNKEELDIEVEESSNDSSLVIRWNAKVGERNNFVLLGGDAGVDVWKRIWQDYKDVSDSLKWHVLVAPHHCSRSSIARKNDDDEYIYSDDALAALSKMDGHGFITSSSKTVKNEKPNPPSFEAKGKYLDILHNSKDDGEDRFFCTGSHDDGSEAPVVFKFTSGGINTTGVKSAATAVGSSRLTSDRSTYGAR